jgi:organic radical activating enzyme
LNARVVEVFSSLQGEGPRLGERQIFARLGACNLRCDYCDEPDTIPSDSGALWPLERLVGEIERLAGERPHKAVSWTGGEPLLQDGVLAAAVPKAKALGLENVLETNAVLPEKYHGVKHLFDAVAVDLKLPSAIGFSAFSKHARFLEDLPAGSYAKVVLTEASKREEWGEVVALIAGHAPKIPLFLQPATPFKGVKPIPSARAMEFYFEAKKKIEDVRVVPQWHPVWGIA